MARRTALAAVLHYESDTLTEFLKQTIPGFDAAYVVAKSRRGAIVSNFDQELMDNVERSQGGLGYGTLSGILGERRPLTVLSFENIAPSLANVANGTYPFVVGVRFVVGPNTPARAHEFIAFAKSRDGARILRNLGIEPSTGGQ